MQPVVEYPLGGLAAFVRPLLARVGRDPDSPLFDTSGQVQGDVRAAIHIELAAKAVVVGNVYYNLIEMVMGSEVNGNLMHIGSNQPRTNRLTANHKKLPFNSKSLQE